MSGSRSSTSIHIRTSGKVFCIIAFLIQLAAANTGENLFYLVGGAILSFLAMSCLLSWLSLLNLSVSRTAPDSVHRLEPFTVWVRLRNSKKFMPSVSLRIQTGLESSYVYVDKLSPGGDVEIRVEELLPKRGIHVLPTLHVTSGFPFGLFSCELKLNDEREVVVYPRVRSLNNNVLDQLENDGRTPKVSIHVGDEFYSLREYAPGDDIRHISWKISARVGKWIIRDLEPSTSRQVMLVMDTRGVPNSKDLEEDFEAAFDLAASLVVALITMHFKVGLVGPDYEVELGKGTIQTRKLMQALARMEAQDGGIGEEWMHQGGDPTDAARVYLATDPFRWGDRPFGASARVLHPGEVMLGATHG
jgi:uncharacterized protein (DUF58 family)